MLSQLTVIGGIDMTNGENRLTGRMTTDYFAFFCPNCNHEIPSIVFSRMNGVVPEFSATCPECKRSFTFKMNVGGINFNR